MFRLTNKLAVSNLIKNRKLYYPFALAVLLAVTVTYLFYSLTSIPRLLKSVEEQPFRLHLDLVCLSSPLRQPLSSSMPIVLS